jgi:YbgC/YbaW family acyl-CoA thioester hydrolase
MSQDFHTLPTSINPLSQTKTLVRFQDCDPFGHLNNVQYLNYFLNARDNQVRYDYGVDLYQFIQTQKQGWVILKNEIAYLKAATAGEEIVLRTATVQFTEYEALVEGRMLNAEQTHLKSLFWMHLAFIDTQTGRRIKHPDFVQNFFAHVRLQEFDWNETTFDKRLQDLQHFYRQKRKESANAEVDSDKGNQ